MSTKEFLMGNEAIALAAKEAGVSVVAGYPGTPASEIIDASLSYGIYAEWSANEKHAFEAATGASLCNQRAMAVMKHNGTNVVTDFLMHVNFTGVRGGLVLVSADDPGGNSSQNEEDTRILIHNYAHLPVFDPSSIQEAKEMIKKAFELSEQTELVFALRPVMRICHARGIVEKEDVTYQKKPVEFKNDRGRFVMSAVVEKEHGGVLRPIIRHRWLNQKQNELKEIMENLPFNHMEKADGQVGYVGCGIGYSYLKEAESILDKKLPILKLTTLPLPEKKVVEFVSNYKKIVVFEELEPVVENLIKGICYDKGLNVEILGRKTFLPAEGELSTGLILKAIESLEANKAMPKETQSTYIPARVRTQCVGCSHRGLLYALKQVVRKTGAIVTGDIGCHDAGSFQPMNLQSTIYCMGSSIPMAYGIKAGGYEKPVIAMIGDSTFFHNGLTGLASAIFNKANITVIIADNSTTAMTGFQPHPGSETNVRGEQFQSIDPAAVAKAMGAKTYICNPYNVEETKKLLAEVVKEEGVKVVIARALCYLKFAREGRISFEPKKITVDPSICNGCKICVSDFGCPAITIVDGKARIDQDSCNGCGVCVSVCVRGAMKQ